MSASTFPLSLAGPPDPFAIAADLFDPVDDPYIADPVGWVTDQLGEFTWSKQRQILEAVRDHRYTAVPSCHSSGKSFIAARTVVWWLSVHEPGEAFVVTTAPTDKQVKAILWREIGRARRSALKRTESLQSRRARAVTDGRITLDAQLYASIDGEDELVAYGRKPQDLSNAEEAGAAFQGIHARYVLVVLDEASGIPVWLWNAVDTLASNEHARVLAIGNPDDGQAQFEKVCRPGSGWHTIPIDGYDTPNFTGEQVPEVLADQLLSPTWVEERKQRWGEDSSLFQSKVRGRFPEDSEEQIVTPSMIRAAQKRDLAGDPASSYRIDEGRYGIDIARFGDSETAGYLNRGGVVRKALSRRKQSTARTTGDVAALLTVNPGRIAVVDSVGVGAGVYDRLREQGLQVRGFQAGDRAHDPSRFVNRRAEAWWALREAFEEGQVDLDPADDDLAAQLQAPKWWRDSRGRVVLESKEEMRKRGVPSPDRADAVVMSFVAPEILPPELPDPVRQEARGITAGAMTERY